MRTRSRSPGSRPVVTAIVWLGVAMSSACAPDDSPPDHLDRAREHYAAGEFRAATIETRNALKGDPDDAGARLLLGELRLRTGDPAAAEKELRKARELGASDAETRAPLARALLEQRKFDELVAIDDEGLTPADAASLLASRALGRFASGDSARAREDVSRALELDAGSVEARLAIARLDASQGELRAARDHLRTLTAAASGNAEAWELLGDIDRAERRPEAAVENYGKAMAVAGASPSARLKRAQLEVELDRATDALADLDALSATGLELPEIDAARGQLDLRDGDLASAQSRFEASLEAAPGFVPALSGLSLTHLLFGNLEQAELYGRQLMLRTGESDRARRLLAAVRIEGGRHALAERTIAPLIGSGRADVLSVRMMGTALIKQGKLDEAIDLMSELVRSTPAAALEAASSAPLVLERPPSRALYHEVVRDPDANPRASTGDAGPDTGESLLDANESRLARAIELMGRGRLEDALAEAELLRGALPESPAAHNLIGRIRLAGDDTAQARAAFERALALDAGNLPARRFLAELDLRSDDVDSARLRLETAVNAGADSEGLLLQLARVEARAGNEETMLRWLERAQAARPESIAPVLLLARYHASRGEYERTLEQLATLDEALRDRPDSLQVESAALLLLRRFDAALPRLGRLLELQPEVAQWHYLRAQAHAALGDGAAALDDLTAALELDPDHAPSQLALADAAIAEGELDEAFARVATLRELIPGTPALERIVARYAARESAPDGASGGGAGEDTAARRPSGTEEALAAALARWAAGDRDAAIAQLVVWLESNPRDVAVRMTLANAYLELERIDDAIGEYEAALGSGSATLSSEGRLIALNNLAWYLRDEDAERAIDSAKQAIEVSPRSVAALDTLAMIYLGNGDAGAAKRVFDRASAIGIENPTLLYHGARIEAALGNDDAARALLAPLIEQGRDFPEAADAIRLLDELGP